MSEFLNGSTDIPNWLLLSWAVLSLCGVFFEWWMLYRDARQAKFNKEIDTNV